MPQRAAISNTEVAEAAGKLVGTAAGEVVLGKSIAVAFKGIAFLGKTESGMRLLQQIGCDPKGERSNR